MATARALDLIPRRRQQRIVSCFVQPGFGSKLLFHLATVRPESQRSVQGSFFGAKASTRNQTDPLMRKSLGAPRLRGGHLGSCSGARGCALGSVRYAAFTGCKRLCDCAEGAQERQRVRPWMLDNVVRLAYASETQTSRTTSQNRINGMLFGATDRARVCH
jgi:hypothetical protein